MQNSSAASAWLKPLIVLSLGTAFYVYGFTLRIMPSAMTHELMRGFGINAQLLGILVGCMYWGYTIMQIPSGLLYDRFSSRIILTIATLVCSFGTFLMGLTPIVWIACIGSFVMGLGEAFAFVGVLVLASRWFPPRYFALIVGIVQLMGSVGAIIGEGPVAAIVNHIGWRATILWAALIGFALACLIWLIVRDHSRPRHAGYIYNHYTKTQRLRIVLLNPQTWWLALYSFTIWGTILITAGLWIVPFLMATYHITNTLAAASVSWVWIGIGIGSPLFGWWSDKIGKRRLPLAVSALFGLIPSIFIIYFPPASLTTLSTLLFLFGIGASGQALSFGVAQDNNPPEVAGTAVGLNNMAVVFGGVLLAPLVGFLLHSHWDGQMNNGIPVYSVADYRHALISVPLCAIVSFIVSWFFLKETYCKPQYKFQPG